MVCLNDIPVNGNLAKIRRHVPGGDELHFLFNQCPFFLCYIEFDLYFSFASVHAIAPFRSEGLGHFPTSNFQPTRRSAGGENTEVGTRFLCLLRMFLSLMPLSLTTEKKLFCQTSAKEKRCNSKKIATLSKSCSVLSRTFLFALFFDFGNLFCRCGHNPYACIAHTVKKRVKLPPLCVLCSGRV